MKNTSINTVQTVLSELSVRNCEGILHWFWDEVDWDCLTDKLMAMLAVYADHCPQDVHHASRPYCMTQFVSKLIQLKELLMRVVDDERVDSWVDTRDGWVRPAENEQQDETK